MFEGSEVSEGSEGSEGAEGSEVELVQPPRKRGAEGISEGSGDAGVESSELSSDSSSLADIVSPSETPVVDDFRLSVWSIAGLPHPVSAEEFYNSVYIGQRFFLHHPLDVTEGYFIFSSTLRIAKGVTVNGYFNEDGKVFRIKIRFGFYEDVRKSEKHDRYVLKVRIKEKHATVVAKKYIKIGVDSRKVFGSKGAKKKAKVAASDDVESDEVIVASGTKKRPPAQIAPVSSAKRASSDPKSRSKIVPDEVQAAPTHAPTHAPTPAAAPVSRFPPNFSIAVQPRKSTSPFARPPSAKPLSIPMITVSTARPSAPPSVPLATALSAPTVTAPPSAPPSVPPASTSPLIKEAIELLKLRYTDTVIENLTKKPEIVEAAVKRLMNDPEVQQQAQQKLTESPSIREAAREILVKCPAFIEQIRTEEAARIRNDPKFIADLEADVAQRSIREAFSGSCAELSPLEIDAINHMMGVNK